MLDIGTLPTDPVLGGSAGRGQGMAAAAGVCLESQGHTVGVLLKVRGSMTVSHALMWPPVTAQARRAWADDAEAVFWGAEGIAVLLAKSETGYAVLSRSRRGTGFDYWLGEDDEADVLQGKVRLEASGILRGDDSTIKSRVKQKLTQTNRSDDLGLTAYVVVVEFSQPVAHVEEKAP